MAKGGYIGVDGIARKIKKGYIGVETPVGGIGDLSVGSTVKLNVNGTATDFIIVHKGNPDPTMYDSSCNGTWLLMKDVYEAKAWTTMNNYATSKIPEYLNSTFFNALDSSIQSAIKQVKIPYVNGNGTTGPVASGSSGMSTKIFLLSACEIGVSSMFDYVPADGSCLDYFKGLSDKNTKYLAYKDGVKKAWWLRSPDKRDATSVICIDSDASYIVYPYHSGIPFHRPAFILPSNLKVTNGVVTGAVSTETKSMPKIIKKAYIGVGGVARLCWKSEGTTYYGTITELNAARYYSAATSIGNYALFGGGTEDELADYGTGTKNTVDAYDKSLTRSTPATLTYGRLRLAATSIGNYALFGGGATYGTSALPTVDAYDKSLTKSTPTSLTTNRSYLAATSIGNYALFGGGDKNGSTNSGEVIAYNTSLTKSTPTALSSSRGGLAATSISNYALFGGGAANSRVDAYNASLTRSIPTALSVNRYLCSAASVGDYALFAGGYAYSDGTYNYYASVDAYNTSLTRSTPTALSVGRNDAAGVSIGDYALFAGGQGSTGPLGAVDVYDTKLTRTIQHDLSIARYGASATAIGNYALVAGGRLGNVASSVVDAYGV